MSLDWATESLRLSVFCGEQARFGLDEWKLVTSLDEPQMQQNLAGRRAYIGPCLGGILTVSTAGTRIDFTLQPKAPTEAIEDGYLPTVGLWPDAGSRFVDATRPWLSGIKTPVLRLAFAGSLLAKCGDLIDAYTKLLSLLRSVEGDPRRMRELIYRVSWPLQSKIESSLILNRITTWAVIQLQVQLMIQNGMNTEVADAAPTYVVRLEFDHSTDADRRVPLAGLALNEMYGELVDLALENAELGEVL